MHSVHPAPLVGLQSAFELSPSWSYGDLSRLSCTPYKKIPAHNLLYVGHMCAWDSHRFVCCTTSQTVILYTVCEEYTGLRLFHVEPGAPSFPVYKLAEATCDLMGTQPRPQPSVHLDRRARNPMIYRRCCSILQI